MTWWQWLAGSVVAIIFALAMIFGPSIKSHFEYDE